VARVEQSNQHDDDSDISTNGTVAHLWSMPQHRVLAAIWTSLLSLTVGIVLTFYQIFRPI